MLPSVDIYCIFLFEQFLGKYVPQFILLLFIYPFLMGVSFLAFFFNTVRNVTVMIVLLFSLRSTCDIHLRCWCGTSSVVISDISQRSLFVTVATTLRAKVLIRRKPFLPINPRKLPYTGSGLDISERDWCHVWHTHESFDRTRRFKNEYVFFLNWKQPHQDFVQCFLTKK